MVQPIRGDYGRLQVLVDYDAGTDKLLLMLRSGKGRTVYIPVTQKLRKQLETKLKPKKQEIQY